MSLGAAYDPCDAAAPSVLPDSSPREAVYKIAEAAADVAVLQDLYPRMHRIIADLLYAPNLYFSLYDAAAETICFPYFASERQPVPRPGRRPLGHGLTEYVLRTRKPLLADECAIPRLVSAGEIDPRPFDTVSWLGVPLRVADTIVGTMALQSYSRAHLYTSDDLAVVEHVSRQVAVAIHRRLTEDRRRHLEERLQQADKMESVGRLAGGMAHDLNNLLVPIMGYAELMLEKPVDVEAEDMLRSILGAAQNARCLIAQLLAFSRRQMLRPTFLDLRTVVRELEPKLRHLIGDHVALLIDMPDSPAMVRADRAQMEQVLLDLATNAREAMAEGGTFAIEVGETEIRRPDPASGLRSGPHVLLRARDTGRGMDKETLRSLFEPFFTTKQPCHARGLGLSTVYGIVKQHGGDIIVESESGRGSCFSIFLPRGAASPETTSLSH